MSPSNELVTEPLERILRSVLFKKADRQSRFLRHVVRKHLEGDDGSLREISIGFEAGPDRHSQGRLRANLRMARGSGTRPAPPKETYLI
jgi:hypothetical protein